MFCDVGLSLNIDPKSLERCLSRKTKAVLAVDFAGQLCDYKKIKNFCEENGLDLIQDASQAIGARSDIGIAGGIGTVSIISHNPMKILGAYGEAGSVLTDDKQIAEKLRQLRYSGTINREDCVEPSINARLDTIQAAILNSRLKKIGDVLEKREKNAEFYQQNLPSWIKRPRKEHFTKRHSYYTYQIRAMARDKLQEILAQRGIETRVQHKLLIPKQKYYDNNYRGNFPKAEELTKEILCLPIHEKLSEEQLSLVCDTIRSIGRI